MGAIVKPMTPPMPLTVAQAAERTGEPKRTIQGCIARGELPAIKTGGGTSVYLINQIDLDAWVTGRAGRAEQTA